MFAIDKNISNQIGKNMKIYNILTKQPKSTAVALGFFDGVHLGHQKIISKTVEYKKQRLLPSVITFLQNPQSIIKNQKIEYLLTPEEKLARLEQLGIQLAYILDFNFIKDISAEDFVKYALKEALNAKALVCGFNYHFGRGGTSNVEDLRKMCEKYKIDLHVEPPVFYKGSLISSTRIRETFKIGNIRAAREMLDISKI